MVKDISISIIPRATASSNSPLSVSRAMAVVITLVSPAIFPPTINIAPTSANNLPYAAIKADIIPYLASFTIVTAVAKGDAPKVIAACFNMGFTPTIAE